MPIQHGATRPIIRAWRHDRRRSARASHDSEVPRGEGVAGKLAAGFALGFLPPYLYFVLGRALAGHPVALVLIWVATAVPLVYYYGVGVLLTLELVKCPPDAY
jgi:hypothetical protein